jgi:hypothetical protein
MYKLKGNMFRIWILLGFIGICSAGCTPKYYAILLNNTNEPLIVVLLDEKEREVIRHCVVPAHRQAKMELKFGFLRTLAISGELRGTRKSPVADSELKYWDVGETDIHILLTEKGIYPIQKEYRSNWTNHITEITSPQGSGQP